MRSVYLNEQAAGSTLARTIYHPDGRVLLHEGTVLTKSFIRRLRDKGFHQAYVRDPLVPEVEVDDVVRQSTRIKATTAVHDVCHDLEQEREAKIQPVREAVDEILDDLAANTHLVVGVDALRNHDSYLFVHSVNVTILSVLVAKTIGMSTRRIQKLGFGTMLHDVGKVAIDTEILNKPGPLDDDEWAEVKLHPENGFEYLRGREDVSILSAHVAYQHHERLDGAGYPRGLEGDDIHPLARIAAVADVFDALTADRPYREALPRVKAAEILREESGTGLEERLVRTLLRRVAVYPTGSIVRLRSGAIGVVVAQGDTPAQPVVRVLGTSSNEPVEPYDITAGEEDDTTIRLVLPEYPEAFRRQLQQTGTD